MSYEQPLPPLPRMPVRRSAMPAPDMAAHLQPREGVVLYYPGAGTDYGPMQYFARHLDLAAVVYVDYLARPDWIVSMLCSVTGTMPELQRVKPRDLGRRVWADFWPADPASRMFAKPTRAFGFTCELQLQPHRSTRLIYLAAEGHQTFGNLLGTRLQPDLVVLQDHGFGGNWRDFGGDSPMYRMAQAAGALPPLLFSATGNTQPWPGYEAIGHPVLLAGQMHHHRRCLYRRHDGIADHSSPLNRTCMP